jgi:hypothetical protein
VSEPLLLILFDLSNDVVDARALWSKATTKSRGADIIEMEPNMSSQLNNILLKVKERDSSAVYEVSFSYGMYQMSWEDLHQALLDKSSDGLIGKEGFARFFRELSDDDSSWSTAKADLERRVMGIFDCFDRTGSDYCDVDELTCGLSLFIRG